MKTHGGTRMANWNWSELIEEQKLSGKSISEFCNEKGVHYTSFYKNRKKLSKSSFIEIKPHKKKSKVLETEIRLKYKDFSLKIPLRFNKQSLKEILLVIGDM